MIIIDLLPTDAFQVEYCPMHPEEKWRLPFIKDILEAKNDQMTIMNIEEDDLDDMLDILCTS